MGDTSGVLGFRKHYDFELGISIINYNNILIRNYDILLKHFK